jgi:uncharacterized YceG family protein
LSRGDRSRPGRERTAQERERDRQERARRRDQQRTLDAPPDPSAEEQSASRSTSRPEREIPEVFPPTPPPAVVAPPVESPAVESPTVESSPPAAPPQAPPIASSTLPSRVSAQPLMTLEELAASAGARAPRRRRSLIARAAAVLALAAVVVAVVLVLHSRQQKAVAPLVPPPVVKVLIPEGKTRAQIAQITHTDGLKGDYIVASRHSRLLNPDSFGAPKGTPDLEGFLFPATYDMDPGAQASRLVEEQLVAFRENFSATDLARARALHITPYQMLIVASMVEREAQIPGDRPKIAAVIYNRLAQGMPLGIDASIYYAVEKATGVATYTQELTEAQLHIDSPYNTRTHVGLPPTPISNPGAASIHAAAFPAHVAYLYYVAGADGCGEQVFSNTQSEFEVNAAAYKSAVARNGGHAPVCKHK